MSVVTSEPIPGVIEVRLNWPEVRNAMAPAEAIELSEALLAASKLPEARVIVLSAEGNAFSAGGNLHAISEMASKGSDYVQNILYSAFQNLHRTIRDTSIPVIALVEGPAVGLGCDLALACDARVAGERASFRYGWAAVGLTSAVGGILEMKRLAGGSRLWQFIAGQSIGALRADELGIALYSDDARAFVLTLAEKLARLELDVLESTKKLSKIDDITTYLPISAQLQAALITKPGFAERAFEVLGRSKDNS